MKRLIGLTLALTTMASIAAITPRRLPPGCAPDNGGLKLPPGFCATLFADSLGAPRHLVVAPNGDVIVALRETRRDSVRVPGGVVILRDANGDGIADSRNKFGNFNASEVQLLGNALYTENSTAILRYRLAPGAMAPSEQIGRAHV